MRAHGLPGYEYAPPRRHPLEWAIRCTLTLSLSIALVLFGIGAYSGLRGMATPAVTSTPRPAASFLPTASSLLSPPPIVFPKEIPLVTHTPAPRGATTPPSCDYAAGYGQTCRWTDPTPTPIPLPVCVTPIPGELCEWRSSLGGPAGG